MSFDITPYSFLEALRDWGIVFGIFLLIVLVVGLVASLLVGGASGVGLFFGHLLDGVRDMARMSPRRVGALAQLTFREAVRRKTLLVFVVFLAIFMFASWFLPEGRLRPDLQYKAYAATALRVMTWLVIPVVLLLSCWGLPQDIKDRSLHTVVTKPTRRSEVVLGRIVGFTAVGTLMLAAMSVFGYFWIVRNFPAPTRTGTLSAGGTDYTVTATLGPRTAVTIADPATGASDTFRGSNRLEVRDRVLNAGTAESPKYPAELAEQTEQLVAELEQSDEPVLVSRVPLYGDLSYTDREGNPVVKGINVGDIWEFRGYIEGNTRASALWEFDGVTQDAVGDTLVLASSFEAFRTHKGTMGQGLEAEFQLLNDLRSQTAAALATAADFGPVRESIIAGDFAQAAERLREAAATLGEASQLDQAQIFVAGYGRFADHILPPLIAEHPDEPALGEVRRASADVAAAARAEDAPRTRDALSALADLLERHAAPLAERLTDLVVPLESFVVQEFRENVQIVPRHLTYVDRQGAEHEADLYDDLVHGGALRVRVRCLDSGQFLGMARPDLFIRTPDKPLASSYFKATLGTWLMMTLVVVLGVTASTFVKGPVATLLVFTLLLLGLGFHSFMGQLLGEGGEKQIKGGFGTIESAVRLIRHQNPFTEMEEGTSVKVIRTTDRAIRDGLWLVYKVVPNFNTYSLSPYVANRFDIRWGTTRGLLPAVVTTLGFIIPCLLIGYYSLKLRELEAK